MTQPVPVSSSLQVADLDAAIVNTIRFLAIDGVQKANSGHPGMPMGTAALAYVLWDRFLKHSPSNPDWPDRDRFVLSAGHGSMLLYSLLHLTGYDLPMEELKQFRQWGSKTPGHPEYGHTAGVETTTGPLGQGFANGVGMAIAERHLAARFNRPGFAVVDHYTYGIVSDGDLMEGLSHEAASLAGHLGLGKLIYFYDDNKISIDGSTELAFTENVGHRFSAYGWQVITVTDGNDLAAVEHALNEARSVAQRPTLIVTRTHIGFGSPNKQDTAGVHGSPLGKDEIRLTRKKLGWPEEGTFLVPDAVREHMSMAVDRGREYETEWASLMARYAEAYPEDATTFKAWLSGTLPEGWDSVGSELPLAAMATRKASGAYLNAIGPIMPNLVGGSADLTPSNNTYIEGRVDFQRKTPDGAYFHFGVREHAMASVCNGIILHGGLRPYCATFLIFSDYMRPAIRLSALMGVPVIYVFTHDSVGLGEDGPTHQPVEHYMALRAIPNLTFVRPADATETVEAWRAALAHSTGPTALALTRQSLPALDREQVRSGDGADRGAYILSDDDGVPDLILMASGSEVQLIEAAALRLREEGKRVRVVSMPSWELFEAQADSYRAHVLPVEVTARLAVEAGVSMGWERYTGSEGRIIGLDHFGASAPFKEIFEHFGFSVDHVVDEAHAF